MKIRLNLFLSEKRVAAQRSYLNTSPIWNECSRLIANCVICYNSILLSELLKQKQEAGDWEAVEELKKVSPISWQHINFHGKYEFDKNIEPIDIVEVVRKMMAARNSEEVGDES